MNCSLSLSKWKIPCQTKVKSTKPNTEVGSISLYVALWNIGSQTYFSTLEGINLSEGNQILLVWLPNYDFSLESHLRKLWTPFSSPVLISSIFSFPEDHPSSFWVTVSHPYLILAASQCVLTCGETGCPGRCQALCILTSHSLHSPFFPLLSSFSFY